MDSTDLRAGRSAAGSYDEVGIYAALVRKNDKPLAASFNSARRAGGPYRYIIPHERKAQNVDNAVCRVRLRIYPAAVLAAHAEAE